MEMEFLGVDYLLLAAISCIVSFNFCAGITVDRLIICLICNQMDEEIHILFGFGSEYDMGVSCGNHSNGNGCHHPFMDNTEFSEFPHVPICIANMHV